MMPDPSIDPMPAAKASGMYSPNPLPFLVEVFIALSLLFHTCMRFFTQVCPSFFQMIFTAFSNCRGISFDLSSIQKTLRFHCFIHQNILPSSAAPPVML